MSQLGTGTRWRFGVLLATGLLVLPGAARAQDLGPGAVQVAASPAVAGRAISEGRVQPEGAAPLLPRSAPQPRTFGTTSSVVHTIQAFAFMPVTSTTAYTASSLSGGLACGGNAWCYFQAPVLLPAGVLVTSIQGEFCDSDAAALVSVDLYRISSSPSGTATLLGSAGTTSTGTPGCVLETAALAVPETIDNQTNTYFVQLVSGPFTATFFRSVRIFYTLQVSAAPATATFGDVPTSHPFFRFVEALAASGITAGCGGGSYCPDAPLTRGQMAVFLSKGLGLHFAP